METLFPGQQPDEQIYLVIRQHWFYLLSKLMLWFVFIILLIVADRFLPSFVPMMTQTPYSSYYDLFKNIFMLFVIVGVFVTWVMYYLNFQIITSQRIVDVSQDGLFSHTVSELDLSRIEDVTSKTRGFWGTVFSFGNVNVQTAGETDHFNFEFIPHPDKVEKMILDLFQKLPNQKTTDKD